MERILRLPEVKKMTSLSTTGIYTRMQRNEFPKSIPLGPKHKVWIESEVQAWINALIEKHRAA